MQKNGNNRFSLVGLSEFESNKYKTILQEKRKVLSKADKSTHHTSIISTNNSLCNKEIDEFGETAVKRLTQPYRKKFADEEIEQIVFDYKSGKTTIELGKEFNCGKNTINSLLKQ